MIPAPATEQEIAAIKLRLDKLERAEKQRRERERRERDQALVDQHFGRVE